MRRHLLPALLLLLLLPACTMATRARAPSFLGGGGPGDSISITPNDDACTELWKMRIENAILKEKLKNEGPTPEPAAEPGLKVPLEIKADPVKLRVVPEKESGALPVG